MKKTGRTLYISGEKTTFDIATNPDNNPATYTEGLIPIWENERKGYGYIVRFISAFPSINSAGPGDAPFILTTYSARDCKRLKEGGAGGINQTLKILGIQAGIAPAENDRVIGVYYPYSGNFQNNFVVKWDSLIVQSLSLGVDNPKQAVTYYIEMDEYKLSDDETVLALLGESDMNVGNMNIIP